MSSREILRITHRGGRNYTFNNRGTSPALQATSLSQGHQSWFPPSPRSATELPCSVGSPPRVDIAIWRQPVAWPQGWQVAISPPKVWWLFLLLALTRPGLEAALTSALESCAAQPDLGCPVALWWRQLSMQAMQAVPRPGTRVFPGGARKLHPCSLTPT